MRPSFLDLAPGQKNDVLVQALDSTSLTASTRFPLDPQEETWRPTSLRAAFGRGRVRSPGAKIRLECFCVSRQPTYQPRGALDGHEVLIDTLKVTPNRYPYIRTVASSGEENKILSVLNACDFSHDLGQLQTSLRRANEQACFEHSINFCGVGITHLERLGNLTSHAFFVMNGRESLPIFKVKVGMLPPVPIVKLDTRLVL